MKNCTRLFIVLLLSIQAIAQQKLDYDTDSRWFWGLNVGSTWSKADVAKQNDWGFGLTIGKAFNYNYGRKLSFDLRGRYLTGEWFGQNYDTTDISGIYPYNLPGTDYSSTFGYSVLNHKTRVHELSLELVIHANNFRARTGWDPYVFGGIGYSWYKSMGNLLGSDGNIIQYDQLVATNDISKESITDVFGVLPDYETNLINDPAHEFARNWMPSLGVGLGYQFGKRFSMGIEHKTTFTRADNFDGYISPTGKYANDWYHYTSFYMTFQLRAHEIEEPERKPELVDQTTPTVKYPPIVSYRNPMSEQSTVNVPTYQLVVSVANVLEQQQVQITQNGKPIYFNWNRNSGTASANVTLQLGANVFTTTGTNQVGTDQETVTIIYERLPEPPIPPVVVKVPPVVTITNPAVNPKEVTTATYAFESTVLNVTQQNQITVQLNGQNILFTFNPTTHQITGNLMLIQGANTLQVSATNADGLDSKQTTLIFRPVVVKVPPVVTITNPAVNPKEVTTSTYAFESMVLNVTQQNQITVQLNGQNIPFTFNPTSHQVTGNLTLIQGANTLQVSATNTDGSDSKQTTLIYRPIVVKLPPVVTITNPAVNPKEVTTATYAFESTVLNVTQQNQITVQLNGQNILFTFNPTTHQVTGNLTLIQGANTLQVSATNADGSDSKQTVLIYQPAPIVLLPVVSFVQPQTPGQLVSVATYNMIASVLHVTTANQVTVSLNGQQMPANTWSFNANAHSVSMNTTLLEGNNVFVVTATNTAGTASATSTIIYRVPVVECLKPTITVVQPTALISAGTVNQAEISVSALVTAVQAATAVTCRLNGVVQPAGTYTMSNQTYQTNLTLVNGQNVIELSATNNCGTTTITKTIVYRAPQIQKPVITLKSPTTCPALLTRGPQVVTGTISGVINANQVTIVYNNTPVAFTSTIANNTLTFTCTITVLATTSNFPLVITATNQAGVTVKECLISIKDYAGGGNDQTSPVDGGKPTPTPAKPRTPIVPTDTIRKPIITPSTAPAKP